MVWCQQRHRSSSNTTIASRCAQGRKPCATHTDDELPACPFRCSVGERQRGVEGERRAEERRGAGEEREGGDPREEGGERGDSKTRVESCLRAFCPFC